MSKMVESITTNQIWNFADFIFSPIVLITIGLLIYVIAVSITRRDSYGYVPLLTILISTLISTWNGKNLPESILFGGELANNVVNQNITLFILSLSVIWVALFFATTNAKTISELGYVTLFVTVASIIVVTSQDLVIAFLALELQAFTFYVIVGIDRGKHQVVEASLKYFTLGALASITFILGTGIIYWLTGTTNLTYLGMLFTGGTGEQALSWAIAASMLIHVSLWAKIGLFPFYSWFVDVYTAIPNPLVWATIILPKIPYFFLMFVIQDALPRPQYFEEVFTTVIILTLVMSALGALTQWETKRFIAYSVIFNNGFIAALGLVGTSTAFSVLLSFILVYGCILATIYTIINISQTQRRNLNIRNLLMWNRNNMMTGIIVISLLALIGLPPFSFFITKFYLLAILTWEGYTAVALVVMLASVLAAYYYLRVIKLISFKAELGLPNKAGRDRISKFEGYMLVGASSASLGLILFPNVIPMIATLVI